MTKALIIYLEEREKNNFPTYPVFSTYDRSNDFKNYENNEFNEVLKWDQMLSTPEEMSNPDENEYSG